MDDQTDDQTSNENPSADFNKLDLSQLQGFSFGTQWTQDKAAPSRGGDTRGERPPRRPDDRDRLRAPDRPRDGDRDRPRRNTSDAPASDAPRRDRRNFRKPAPAGDAAPDTHAPAAPAEGQHERRPHDHSGDRPPRREHREGGDAPRDQRPPRRDFRGGDRPPRHDERDARHGAHRPHARHERAPAFHTPYISPHYTITFYPDDTGFNALIKAMRASCRTYELFEIARVVVGKNDRFVATIQRKQPDAPTPQPAGTTGATEPPAPARAKLPPLAISVPDGLVFDSEDAAIAHVIGNHLGNFFDTAEVEVEPPKGNYQVINKCGVTGELLAPPNYHRYNQIVQQHYATRVTRMGFEAFRARIETVRDPEVVKQWLEKMKKTTRYTWKLTPPAEGAQPIAFDAFEEARAYLVENVRDKLVRLVGTARLPGRLLEKMQQGELRRAIEGALERQRRFPLETANGLRGRLRRENFTIYKKGSKGISYVCAVKRKYRIPGQVFADSIGALITFIETNPMVKASELPAKFLGIQPAEPPKVAGASSSRQGEQDAPPTQETSPVAEQAEVSPPAASGSVAPFVAAATVLSAEDQARLHRLTGDLRWLVSEGYVTEFIDGRLFAPSVMTEARKREVETEEHDPENFPDTPGASADATDTTGTDENVSAPEDTGVENADISESPVLPEAASESAEDEPVAEPEPELVPDAQPPPARDPEPASEPSETHVPPAE